jgi:hypothetical protein
MADPVGIERLSDEGRVMGKYGKSASGRDRTDTEVFTPDWLVKDMCDMLERENLEDDVFSPWHTFLEPSCGDGNFVVEILKRKFSRCTCRTDYTIALKSVYGMDIQADNISECILRVTELCKRYFKPTKQELQIINDHYIMCDSLKIMKMIQEDEHGTVLCVGKKQ